jgi:hypothetical protein
MRVEWYRRPAEDGPRIAGTWTVCEACGNRFDHWRKGDPPLPNADPKSCPVCEVRFTGRPDVVVDSEAA